MVPRPIQESATGVAINRKLGTQAVFQLSSVSPHLTHSKLLICRAGAMDSVRR
jgi:hypothetical protein